jgi:hypothetical protein
MFWTSSLFYDKGVYHQLKYDEVGVNNSHFSLFVGFSVRCVKDL